MCLTLFLSPCPTGQGHADEIHTAALLLAHHCHPPYLSLLVPLWVPTPRSLHHGKQKRGQGDSCVGWEPGSWSPPVCRCPTSRESSLALSVSGCSGSIHRSQTETTGSCKPEVVPSPTPRQRDTKDGWCRCPAAPWVQRAMGTQPLGAHSVQRNSFP